MEERLNRRDLYFTVENYKFLKERYVEKMDAMLHYAFSDTKCRSQLLLEYFGEKNSKRCGSCDVCEGRNELDMSKYEFDLILGEIKSVLKKEALLIPELATRINYPEEKFMKVFRWLLDHGKIERDILERFLWNE